jgi:hypothetical protein
LRSAGHGAGCFAEGGDAEGGNFYAALFIEENVFRFDVAVAEFGEEFGLVSEAGGELGIALSFGGEDLDGDGAVERFLARFVNNAHAAAAEAFQDFELGEPWVRFLRVRVARLKGYPNRHRWCGIGRLAP